MKKIIYRTLIFGLILIAAATTLSAQESTTLQFMKGIPQSDLLNPALHNDSSSVVVGLPGLSGMYFDFNSPFAINDLIHKGTGTLADSLVLDIDHFNNVLGATNTILQHFSVPLFYLGIRSKKSFFSFGVTEKELAQFSFDKSLVTFVKDGNAAYMGQNFDLGNLKLNAFDYTELALGFSRDLIKNQLTVAVKAKVLLGKMAFQTERMNLKVETAANGSYLNLSSDMKVNMSVPATIDYKDGYFSGMNGNNIDPAKIMLQTGNTGMAFDLGVVYKLTPKIIVSGSIIDLGKISFKNDIHNLSHVSSYKWEGIDFSKSLDQSKSDYVDPATLVDAEKTKIENSFKPKQSEFGSAPFDVTLPTKIYMGANYQLTKVLDIGVLERIYKSGTVSQSTFTVSANAMLGKFFGLTGSYSTTDNAAHNLGLGMSLRLGALQWYMVSDNALALGDPSKAKLASIRFGLNLLFGRNHKPKFG